MKTHTSRIQKNATTEPSKPQAPAAQTAAPTSQPISYILALDEFKDGKTVHLGEVNLTLAQYAAIEHKMRKPGKDCANDLLTEAAEFMAEAADSCELENSVFQSNALLKLMFNQIEYTRLTGDSLGNEDDNGRLTAGLQELMWATQKRLEKAFSQT